MVQYNEDRSDNMSDMDDGDHYNNNLHAPPPPPHQGDEADTKKEQPKINRCCLAIYFILLIILTCSFWFPVIRLIVNTTAGVGKVNDYVYVYDHFYHEDYIGIIKGKLDVKPTSFLPLSVRTAMYVYGAVVSMLTVFCIVCDRRGAAIFVLVLMVVLTVCGIVMTVDSSMAWSEAETSLPERWSAEISKDVKTGFNGLMATQMNYRCCGIKTGCSEINDSWKFSNGTSGTCMASNCADGCESKIPAIKMNLFFYLLRDAVTAGIALFLSALTLGFSFALRTPSEDDDDASNYGE